MGNQGAGSGANYSHAVPDMDFELKNYRITHFCFLQSFYNFYGIVAGTNTGAIKVTYDSLRSHKRNFKLCYFLFSRYLAITLVQYLSKRYKFIVVQLQKYEQAQMEDMYFLVEKMVRSLSFK